MTAADTRNFMALCSIAQHFGRPGVPTDQAPIESFFGHIKTDWPHLEDIDDPEILDAELERVRHDYNGVRLHAAIGYITPNDEHEGRGDAIRQARRDGLAQADQARRATRRPTNHHRPEHPR
jgi:transposase InsO family protein